MEDNNIDSVDIQSQEGAKSKLENKNIPERKNHPGSTSKKQRKTKLEKSLEVLTEGFRQVTEKETEELRHQREIDYQIEMKELENERRQED